MGRWERWKGNEVAKWERWESAEVGSWEVPGFIKGGEYRVSPRFCLFVSDANQGNKGVVLC